MYTERGDVLYRPLPSGTFRPQPSERRFASTHSPGTSVASCRRLRSSQLGLDDRRARDLVRVKNLFLLVPLVAGPDEVTLQGVGELCEGVWETRGFMFRVLLIPYGPFTEVATASEAMLPRVPLLKALEFRSLSLGCLINIFTGFSFSDHGY